MFLTRILTAALVDNGSETSLFRTRAVKVAADDLSGGCELLANLAGYD
jgi:hypothetical protein